MYPPKLERTPQNPRPKVRSIEWIVALGLFLALLIFAFHAGSRSARSELGAHPDEAAHFVTGLMVRDYLVSGFHQAPLQYADDYYRHYPKIGLGVWPPFFYVVQAVWTLVLPAGVRTVLWLMMVLGLALGVMTGGWLGREFGKLEAGTGAVLLMALPLVQQYGNMVMAEMLSAVLMFAAAGYFARYIEGKEWPGAIGFGICSGLAIMTKGTGLALMFVPVFAIIFTGSYELLVRRSLWAGALLVGVIAGPWTWHFRKAGLGGWEQPSPSLGFTEKAMGFYAREMGVALGWLLAALAVAGAVSLFLPGKRKPAIGFCSLALVLAVWIFQCLMPVGLEARHLMPTMPALIVLAMTGLHAVTEHRGRRVKLAAAAAVLAVFFGWPLVFHPAGPEPGYGSIGNNIAVSPFRVPKKVWGGFEPVAEAAVRGGANQRILVASDARGEGMFIADVAMLDAHRPSYTVERASKILASSTWSGSGYASLYQTPAEVSNALENGKIDLVVTDGSLPQPPAHEKLLAETVESYLPLATSTARRDGAVTDGAIVLYRAPWAPK